MERRYAEEWNRDNARASELVRVPLDFRDPRPETRRKPMDPRAVYSFSTSASGVFGPGQLWRWPRGPHEFYHKIKK